MPDQPDPRAPSRTADARPLRPDGGSYMLAGSRRALADAYRLLAERYADPAASPAMPARQGNLDRIGLQPSRRRRALRLMPGRAGEKAMAAAWSTEDGELHATSRDLGGRGTAYAKVESMGEVGWDWHAWDASGKGQPRYSLADTLGEAKRKAERALQELARELGAALAA